MRSSYRRHLFALVGFCFVASACVQILGDDFEIDDAGTGPGPGTGECSSEPTCSACDTCANDGPCQQARDACEQNQDCMNFRGCMEQCGANPGDPHCVPSCEEDYDEPTRNLFYEWFRCVYCEQCVGPCGTAPQC